MDYGEFTREELIYRIKELESSIDILLKEKERIKSLDFYWQGNLGHWNWDVKKKRGTFIPFDIMDLGLKAQEKSIEIDKDFYKEKIHPDDYEKAISCMENHLAGKTDVYELEYRIKSKNGTYRWYYDRGRASRFDKEGQGIFVRGIIFDINKRKQEELTLKKRVMTDSLTKLKNRRAAIDFLKDKICLDNPLLFSIALLDLDDFSLVNNTKGHLVGDKVLKEVGEIMKKSVRKTDLVARYGGEEFLIIYPHARLKAAHFSTERIRKAVEEYIFSENTRITISGGVCEYNGETVEEFINKADLKLYEAKKDGKNKIV